MAGRKYKVMITLFSDLFLFIIYTSTGENYKPCYIGQIYYLTNITRKVCIAPKFVTVNM